MKYVCKFSLLVLLIITSCQTYSSRHEQDATATLIPPKITSKPTYTYSPEPSQTPTQEPISFIDDIPLISIETLENDIDPYEWHAFYKNNGMQFTSGYSTVNFEDFLAGEVLEKEQSFIFSHPPFSGEVKNEGLWFNKAWNDEHEANMVALNSNYLYADNPTMRYVKLISIYKITDNEFFKKMGVNLLEMINSPYYGLDIRSMTEEEKRSAESLYFWLITWAYHSPSGEVRLIHTFVYDFYLFAYHYNLALNSLDLICQFGNDLRPWFVYDYKFNISSDEIKKKVFYVLAIIYQNHPELKPDTSLVNQWVRTGDFPDDLQNKLFGYEYGWCW